MIRASANRSTTILSGLCAGCAVVLALVAFNTDDHALGVGWLCAAASFVLYLVAANKGGNKMLLFAALPFALAFFAIVGARVLQ